MRPLLIGALLSSSANAHSWLGCSDYRGDVNNYDESKCMGFPRPGFPTGTGTNLGNDVGYNYQPGAGQSACQSGFGQSYQHAVYEQGNTYCLAWPTKNHASASCTNAFIPDTEFSIFRSGVNPTADPSQNAFRQNKVPDYFGTHQNGVIDCLGYQRSPRFCDNTDKALATGCFSVPSDLPVGKYVFQWYWVFNPGSPYTTCFDVEVVAPGQGNGGGGLLNADAVDTSGEGLGATCATSWASQPGYPWKVGTAATGGTTTTPTTPAVDPANRPTLTGDDFHVWSAPTQINVDGSDFVVKVDYSATAARTIVVDLLVLDIWLGKGVAQVTSGKGTVEITVSVTKKILSADQTYRLSVWMVDKAVHDAFVAEMEAPTNCGQAGYAPCTQQPWTEELMSTEIGDMKAGSSTIYPPPPSTAAAAGPKVNRWLAATTFALLAAARRFH
jgi:hypothetical protein